MNLTHPYFDDDEIAQLKKCLASHWVTQGPMTTEFERLVRERHAARYALATTSCTAALHLATLALELKTGDEVLVPAFTWITSANAAEYVGGKAVFVDVDPATFNIDPARIEAAVTPRTRAIMAVHLFGLAAPMNEIAAIAQRHGLAVIEDAACAIGSEYHGKPVGALGDIGCFSFHPRKVITTGEGGMVTTNRNELAEKVVSLRNHGATGLPPASEEAHGPWTMATFGRLGYNLRLSDIQAAVGVAQMAKLDRLLVERRGRARRYTQLLGKVEEIATPWTGGDNGGHSYQSYVIRLLKGGRGKRNGIMAALAAQGIQTRPGTHSVPKLGYYRDRYGLDAGDFPVATMCEDTTITLPIFPGMTDGDQDTVVSALTKSLAK